MCNDLIINIFFYHWGVSNLKMQSKWLGFKFTKTETVYTLMWTDDKLYEQASEKLKEKS